MLMSAPMSPMPIALVRMMLRDARKRSAATCAAIVVRYFDFSRASQAAPQDIR